MRAQHIDDDLAASGQCNTSDYSWAMLPRKPLQDHFLHDMCELDAHKDKQSWLNAHRDGDSKSE